MDLDISSLLNALQTTQQKKSSVRLSERNVVELVMKLKQLGLFGEELLHTINGKEYITTDRLKADIQTALRHAGGRLELTELPALVGVDLAHCEKQAALIVAESNGNVLEAQGELITVQYFDSLAAEINDLLQESGVISMADLAITYSLNTELLRSIVSSRMGSIIQGQLEGGLLYTPAYVRNIKAQLRGALRGTAAPVALNSLVKDLGLDGFGSSNSMVAQLVDELLHEGAVKGTTKGGGGSWVPSIHTSAQQGAVAGFYQQNGYVAYDLVRKAGISNEKSYLKQTFPEGIPLETVYVSQAIASAAEAAVDEALRGTTWLDVSTVLPHALGSGDVVQLLDNCSDVAKDKGQVLASTCIVSTPLITAARDKAAAYAKQEADRAVAERKHAAAGSANTSSSNGAPGGGRPASPTKRSASPAKKPAAAAKEDNNDSDDDWSMGSKKGKGKGKSNASKSKGKGSSGNISSGGGSKQQKGGGSSDGGSALNLSVLTDLVLEMYPDMEDAGPSRNLARCIAELIRPAAVAAYQEQLASVFTSNAEARRKVKDSAIKALEDAFGLLQLYSHGCELVQADEATLSVMQRHLLRSTGTDALDALLSWCKYEFVEQDAPLPAAAAAGNGAGAAGLVSFGGPPERSALVKALPPDVGQPVAKAVEAANGADPQELIIQLDSAASECGIRLRRLDKKSEKALLSAQKARLMQLLEAEQSAATALALALPLLTIKVSSKVLNIPGRAIGGVLAALQPSMQEEDFAVVQQFHQLVVESLKQQSKQQQAAEGEQQAEDVDQQLAELLPKLKGLVGIGSSS